MSGAPIELVGEHRLYNLIRCGERFIAVFQGVTDVDFSNLDLANAEAGTMFAADERDDLCRQINVFVETQGIPKSFRGVELLPQYRGYNLFQMGERIFAVMQGLLEFDPDTAVAKGYPNGEVFVGSDQETLRAEIDKFLMEFGMPARFINVRTTVPLTELGPPEVIELEPMEKCNLRCFMCPQHYSESEIGNSRLDPAMLKNLAGLDGKLVVMGANNEPTTHPRFGDIVKRITDLGITIDLTTNGTMLTDRLIGDMLQANFSNLVYSFDGIRKETYEWVRRNASYERSMERILSCHQAFKSAKPQVFSSIQYILMRRTLGEVIEAVDFWNGHGINHMGLLALVVGAQLPELMNERLDTDMPDLQRVLNQAASRVIDGHYRMTLSSSFLPHLDIAATHPANAVGDCVRSDNPEASLPFNARTFFQNGYYPGMHVGCRSPFKYARVYFDGTVRLCTQFSIGTIRDKPFLDIWYGKEAQKVRSSILANPRICYDCDYFRHCLRSGSNERTDERNQYFGEAVIGAYNPTLIETNNLYTIVQWRERYFAVPRYVGHYDVRLKYENRDAHVFESEDLDELRAEMARRRFSLLLGLRTRSARNKAKHYLKKLLGR